MATRILITGGAGFVGSNLALALRRRSNDVVIAAFDNLRRRGSDLSIDRLRAGGVDFIHGDVRSVDDLADAGAFDLLLECSAEPSVHAGYDRSPTYVIQTNLLGTANCLEAARRNGADVVFFSTSRVYPIEGLRALPLERNGSRLIIPIHGKGTGWSAGGIAGDFPLTGHRSMYGATKLASELLIDEYRAMYGLRAVINRCGVISGPWQMGKVDQGFVVHWAARHLFGGSLHYVGFGGEGLQVRDVLHIDDLCTLVAQQIAELARHDGATYNVGGGPERSVSLAELTELCRERTGRTIPIGSNPTTSPADVPYYVTDTSQVTRETGWSPRHGMTELLDDVFQWLQEHRETLEPLMAGNVSTDVPALHARTAS
jgi:CDP-paratose 2-epimerase